jgi:hypothetical protein
MRRRGKGAFFEVILPAFGPSWDLQKVIRATKAVVVKFRGTSEFEILHIYGRAQKNRQKEPGSFGFRLITGP